MAKTKSSQQDRQVHLPMNNSDGDFFYSNSAPKKGKKANCCLILAAKFIHYLVFVPFKIFLCIISLLETSACLWFILICMPTILISPVLYRKIVDFFVEEFCKFTVQLFCITSGAKLKLSGVQIDKLDKTTPFVREALWPVFICNHKTQMDMLAAWLLLYKLNIPCNVIKFMAASYTRYVPGYGCGLQVMRSIFLTRSNTERDLQQIRDIMSFHAFYGIPKGFLMYPEGTTIFKESLQSTNRFAAKNNLPPRKHSLYPRHKGLYELLHAMRDTLVLNELFDMTVAYEEFRGMNEDFTLGRLFFQGPVQKKYHIHLEKHDAIPLSEYSELELRDWLFEVFEEKERRLEFFESNEPPCLDFGNKDEVYNATFTGFEYLAGLSRIIWHLSLVVLIFVLPWYYIRFYKIHEYIGLICYPVALVALTVLGFFVGLDRIERGLERLHLLLICWPLIQWKPDHIPCVHANPDDVRRTPQTKEWFGGGLGARIFGGENNPSLAISSISNRISVWTGRFDFPNSGASAPNPESGVLSELEPRNMPSLEPTEEPNDGTTIHETGHVSALPEETSALLSTPPATSNSSDFDKKEYDTIPQHRQSPPIHIRSQCSNSIASGSVDALLQC